ncbi:MULTISPECIES: UTP--glucose-1-phosphate uridylyltransferase GalU [unclassified Dehalobacter]|uniref:UTP--glucose-1-phosphate uridylyltransferase GalU n=1 Tax=unclassified Dehalobacter TaxID=2635733 RepID=UPI0003A55877|nr:MULTISPECIES: UTP--glucose-1-phosphate uridylyltransferase GalU [unclassified Dehalobacter]RJE47501.1 UTP--glucose-1-phosphate uridylyltransferase [Dehalobacter sp. MCB1]TCX48687.1 UTP--glucose-1-phosphate uridylyltransferase [Dehalobacter sp. 14DCB1]TCX56265.1 UTP--glucose-1-phosphate uridylyltransferase [Dehalobacter sp. 12DCB1]
MRVTKAVIPAAGLGTRFLPVTKALPKEMFPICNKPIIQYIIEEAIHSGIEDIVIITGRGKWSIVDYYDRSPELEAHLAKKGDYKQLEKLIQLSRMANICYIRQNEPLGLGHAIYCAKSFIGQNPFAVLLGDDIIKSDIPAIKQLMEVAEETCSNVIGIKEVSERDVSKYGIIDPLDNDRDIYCVRDLFEKPLLKDAPSRLAIMGRYILNSSIFSFLEKIPKGAGGEFQLTDALKMQSKIETIYACKLNGIRYDAGDKLGFLIATIEYALESSEIGPEFAQYLDTLYERRKTI